MIQIAAVNEPPQPPAAADGAAAAGGKPSPASQRKVWDKPGAIQLPKKYDATTSVVKGMHLSSLLLYKCTLVYGLLKLM